MGSYYFYWISLIPAFCWDFKFANCGSLGSVADDHEPCEHGAPGPGSLGQTYTQTHPKGLPGTGLNWPVSRCREWVWASPVNLELGYEHPLGTKQICLPLHPTQGSQGHLTPIFHQDGFAQTWRFGLWASVERTLIPPVHTPPMKIP